MSELGKLLGVFLFAVALSSPGNRFLSLAPLHPGSFELEKCFGFTRANFTPNLSILYGKTAKLRAFVLSENKLVASRINKLICETQQKNITDESNRSIIKLTAYQLTRYIEVRLQCKY